MSSSNKALHEAHRSGNPGTSDHGWRWLGLDTTVESTAACVEYVGRTALVVTGPYTGARYRFLQPGARVSVDARDRQAMLSIPMLRAVSA